MKATVEFQLKEFKTFLVRLEEIRIYLIPDNEESRTPKKDKEMNIKIYDVMQAMQREDD